MLLKKLSLRNIRSYGDEETVITFNRGSSLFVGDIGSGKSTILQAIEFALFGLGDVDGRHLLRRGSKEGSVTLQFEVDGKEYLVYRRLARKGRGVVQDQGYIIEDGVKTEYSVGEMKLRILEILDFKEKPQPRTTSLIYRYAVYTPQEMMKSVLAQDADRRLDTLRRAFGIEEYRSVVRNTEEIVLREWKGEVNTLSRLIEDLDSKRDALEEERKKRETSILELKEFERQLSELEFKLSRLEEEIRKLQPEKEKIIRLEGEIPALEKEIQTLQARLNESEKREKDLRKKLQNVKDAETILQTLAPKYEEYMARKSELKQLKKTAESYARLSAERAKLEGVITKEEKLLRKSTSELERDVKNLEDDLNKNLQRFKKERHKLEERRKRLLKQIKRRKKVEKEIGNISKALAKTKADITSTRSELDKNRREWQGIKSIGIGAPCPVCKQPLTKQHYHKVKSDYQTKVERLDAQVKALLKTEKVLHSKRKRFERTLMSLIKKERMIQKIDQGLAASRQKMQSLKKNQIRLLRMKSELRKKQKNLDEGNFALKEKRKLLQVNKRLAELEPIYERYEEVNKLVSELEREQIESQYSENRVKAARRKEVERELNKVAKLRAEIQKTIETKSSDLSQKKNYYEERKTILDEVKQLEDLRKELNNQQIGIKERIATKKQYIEEREGSIVELETEISSKEEQKRIKEFHEETVRWLRDYFIPCVEDIEKHVLTSINEEFNQLFQKWFNTLIETGDINVRVDDTFTPIIEQEGYELDIDSLSGGEKSSVALAYRLALNTMVKKVCNAMKSNLLILDEPTDGFSSQQLYRLRDVLKEANCEQVIMVSHEKELEGFVDNIYRIRKENGLSQIVYV
jgi:DNA repair protein SbcC/Rad50